MSDSSIIKRRPAPTPSKDADDESGGELPPRSRRRLVTPWTAGLSALLVAAAGFFAGVEVQKDQGSSGGGRAAAGGAGQAALAAAAGRGGRQGAGGAGAGGAGAGGGATPTFGQVTSKRGSTLYVQDSNGTTVRVKTSSQSQITRTANASAKGIYPGDTVIVQGSTGKNGVISATSVRATAASAAAAGGGGGFFGGRGAGGGAGGGGQAGGGAQSSGSAAAGGG